MKILLEPGRLLVGNAGVLLTRVRYIKTTGRKKFAIIDAGMNDLIRPALYQSYHEIVPVTEAQSSGAREKIDVVGPVCESGDFFALDRPMPELREGDLLAVMSAGAYGFVMASNYNSRPLPAEALVRGDQFALIRKRQELAEMVRDEVEPGTWKLGIYWNAERSRSGSSWQLGNRRRMRGTPDSLHVGSSRCRWSGGPPSLDGCQDLQRSFEKPFLDSRCPPRSDFLNPDQSC